MKRYVFLLLILLIAVVVDAQPIDPTVPSEHWELYRALETRLTEFEGRLSKLPKPDKETDVVFGAELLTANGHRGEQLLSPQAFDGNVVYLDKLQEIGIRAVKVAIPYPLLMPRFPRSKEYTAFYARLAQEIHRRGMKMHVGCGVMFPQSEFTTVPKELLDYSKLTVDEFFEQRKRQVEIIAGECSPDYLTIANEPSTERKLTGLDLTPAGYVGYIGETVRKIRRPGMVICAGAGSWDNPAYAQAFVAIPDLDCLDLHFYPIDSTYQASLIQLIDPARRNQKRVIIGEAWLYKSLNASGSEATWAPTFGLDVFSFWQTLDQRFIEDMVRLARNGGVEQISFFWSKYFFGYDDYDEKTRRLEPGVLLKLGNQAAWKAIQDGQLSVAGRTYQRLIKGK